MAGIWPKGFQRIPNDSWTTGDMEALALGYDTVEQHGWYDNLDPTIKTLKEKIAEGQIILDYSGGTGILADRLFREVPDGRFGILIADSSPKFLRVALEKFRQNDRVAFRRVCFLKDQKRLERMDEVLGESMLARQVDLVVSTNAIHLYYDLHETVQSWAKILKKGGFLHVQSGNIDNDDRAANDWIIDQTVEAVSLRAKEVVAQSSRYSKYRSLLSDQSRMKRYDQYRHKFFLPVKPLEHYLKSFEKAGFGSFELSTSRIKARVDQWTEFLSVYHEGILGWLGGVEKIEGRPIEKTAVEDRKKVLEQAIQDVFTGAKTFNTCWTYINAKRKTG